MLVSVTLVSASNPRLNAAFCANGKCDIARLRLVVATGASAATQGHSNAILLAAGLVVRISDPFDGGNVTTGCLFVNDSALVRMSVLSQVLVPTAMLSRISVSAIGARAYIRVADHPQFVPVPPVHSRS